MYLFYSSIFQELRAAFDRHSPPLLLSAAVAPAQLIIEKAYDVPVLSRNLDFINVMTYDFHTHWEKRTGHVSPLYFKDGDR